jgi:hypothetical protein
MAKAPTSDNGPYTARYWRDRAEEARLMAEGMRHPPARKVMQDVAHSYDQMAELAERNDRSKKPS